MSPDPSWTRLAVASARCCLGHVADRALIDELLARSGTGIGFDELHAAGTIWPDKAVQAAFANGEFETPNGRQLAGDAFAQSGLPQAPSIDADGEPEPGTFRLTGTFRLMSPADPLTMNSS